MQCNWSTKTILLRQSLRFLAGSHSKSTVSLHHNTHSALLKRHHIPPKDVKHQAMCMFSTRTHPNFAAVGEPTFMTKAQLSRTAAETVRMAFQQGRSREAFLVVNSLHYSTVLYDSEGRPRTDTRRPAAIDFGQAVSPRLASHSLLHGLLRQGLTEKAGDVARQMMAMGVKVRSKSLEAAVHSLCAVEVEQLRNSDRRPPAQPWMLDLRKSDILDFCPEMLHNRGTRLAVHLLIAAGRYQQERTRRMFDSLIKACLLQGEIVVASFLFAFLIKQWQLRYTPAEPSADTSFETVETSPQQTAERSPRWGYRGKCPYPEPAFMQDILASIDIRAFRKSSSAAPQSRGALAQSLQALANLAYLLDNRLLPFPKLAPLISALYSCPSSPEIFISVFNGDGLKVRILAHNYFRQVLDRLVSSLPATAPDKRYHLLPPLDTRSCNALLCYALQHRLSLALADQIIEHMTGKRKILPNVVTLNILMRSGTLLRRSDIVSKVLQLLKGKKENADHAIVFEPPSGLSDAVSSGQKRTKAFADLYGTDLQPELSGVQRLPRLSQMLRQVGTEQLDLAKLNRLVNGNLLLKADSYTLTAYIADLTASGKPEIVAHLLFFLIPELQVVDHPTQGPLTAEMRRHVRIVGRRACLERAVRHGPYLFTSVLNALRKAGKTGYAERVWLLAKQAERLSCDPSFATGVAPWCLPVDAYTIMMQCYADEGRRGLALRHPRSRAELTWRPIQSQAVHGWAYFIVATKGQTIARKLYARRDQAARKMGQLLFRSMASGTQHVYESLMKAQKLGGHEPLALQHGLVAPTPDARFFNAALALFGRHRGMYARAPYTRPSRWRRRLRFAGQQFIQRGKADADTCDPRLLDVLRAMRAGGFPIPPGHRHHLIGRWLPPQPRRQEIHPPPYPSRRKVPFIPHALPTVKSRGLPVRRRPGSRRAHLRPWSET